MSKRLGWLMAALMIVAAWAYGRSGAEKVPPAGKPAPAKNAKKEPATDEPLLLLDDEPEAKPAAKPQADNSRCHVCHVNFEKEALALAHARANVGCAKCHGACDAHIADESWTSGGKGTPPDKMYVHGKVNAMCAACHEMSQTEPHKCPFPEMSEKKCCTDCHGQHRLAKRKCKWK